MRRDKGALADGFRWLLWFALHQWSIFPWVSCGASASMGVFPNENGTARQFRNTR